MTFTRVLGSIADRFQVFLKDHITLAQNRFVSVVSAFAVSSDVGVPAGGEHGARHCAEWSAAEGIGEDDGIVHQRADRR